MPSAVYHGTLYHGEERPLASEFLAVGIIGILLYFSILFYASYIFLSEKNSLNKTVFYGSMMLMAIFESPRFFYLAIYQDYFSQIGYALHALSGIFYFICLAIIGLIFANILELGEYSMLIYSKRGLSVTVITHTIVHLAAVGYCIQAASLAEFFGSPFYQFFIVFDIFQNLVYSGVLVVFGLRLITRFNNLGTYCPNPIQKSEIQSIVRRVTLMLVFISVFFIIRLILLGLKFASIKNSGNNINITTKIFTLYGLLWFILSDFLPRGRVLDVMYICIYVYMYVGIYILKVYK
jgi:hypothetical protein